MHAQRFHVVGLLALLPFLGLGLLCPCSHEARPTGDHAAATESLTSTNTPAGHACCANAPADDTDTPTPSPAVPHDCDHCQLQNPLAFDPAPRSELFHLGHASEQHWDIDWAAPLPLGLTQPSLLLASADHDVGPPPPATADTLLSRACQLTL